MQRGLFGLDARRRARAARFGSRAGRARRSLGAQQRPQRRSCGRAMSAIVDFSRARDPLVAAIEGAVQAGHPDGAESLRRYLAALPGSSRKAEAGQAEKVELGTEAKALLELAFRSCLDNRVVRISLFASCALLANPSPPPPHANFTYPLTRPLSAPTRAPWSRSARCLT